MSKQLFIIDLNGSQGFEGSITVRFQEIDWENRQVFRYEIRNAADQVILDRADLCGPVGARWDASKAGNDLITRLLAAAEAQSLLMNFGTRSENLEAFPEMVREWALANYQTLTLQDLELSSADELGL